MDKRNLPRRSCEHALALPVQTRHHPPVSNTRVNSQHRHASVPAWSGRTNTSTQQLRRPNKPAVVREASQPRLVRCQLPPSTTDGSTTNVSVPGPNRQTKTLPYHSCFHWLYPFPLSSGENQIKPRQGRKSEGKAGAKAKPWFGFVSQLWACVLPSVWPSCCTGICRHKFGKWTDESPCNLAAVRLSLLCCTGIALFQTVPCLNGHRTASPTCPCCANERWTPTEWELGR